MKFDPSSAVWGEIAQDTGCAIVLIGHLNKAAGTQSTYRGLGSIDITAAVRSLLFIGKLKDSPTTRVAAFTACAEKAPDTAQTQQPASDAAVPADDKGGRNVHSHARRTRYDQLLASLQRAVRRE